jgi:LPXTG-motif cell wall-anchored protein
MRSSVAPSAQPGHSWELIRATKLQNGVIGGLASLAALYVFGAVGLLVERLTGRSAGNPVIAVMGLALAVSLGVLALRRLSSSNGPGDVDRSA